MYGFSRGVETLSVLEISGKMTGVSLCGIFKNIELSMVADWSIIKN
ncbi:hypothetical protein TIFTF001_007028 [Ficus carica]|uniref:Uncharacterized protein n=1 Tax=Ficus carica TaxID=3494 RepID=A0AA88CWM1_FICCA|nr:hypothetical protein TIFTF001_007028 [Ficus carica]